MNRPLFLTGNTGTGKSDIEKYRNNKGDLTDYNFFSRQNIPKLIRNKMVQELEGENVCYIHLEKHN